MATLDTIKDILQENLDIAPENVDEDSTFDSLGVDSLDMVELICELEERLGVDFGEPEASRPWAISWNTWTACNSKQLCDEDPAR